MSEHPTPNLHVPWRDAKGNTVWLDTYRALGSQLVLASWTAPQNIALGFWAKLVEHGGTGPNARYEYLAKTVNHRRFVNYLPGLEGWLHVALVHEDALAYRQIQGEAKMGYGVDQVGLEERVRQIVPVPMQPGWGLLLGQPKLVRAVPGFGRPAWSISLDARDWIKRIRSYLGVKE